MKPPPNRCIRLALFVIGAFLAATRLCGQEDASRPSRPNILLILADDLGFSDLGCYGSEIATPNVDRLAAEGLRFTQFYNCARCCPTRASLLTGLYPHQAGVGDMEQDLGSPAYQGYLNDRCLTIAEALHQAGYRTLMAGKWNVGWHRPQWPVDRGFMHYFGMLRGASNYFNPLLGPRRNNSQMAIDGEAFTSFDDRFYMTDAFTDYALRWLDEAGAQQPFFLYVAYTAPHSPLHAWPDDIARYQGKYRQGWDVLRQRRYQRQVASGLVDAGVRLPPRDPKAPAWDEVDDQEFRDLKMAVYAAQVDRMDRGIGKILAKIKDLGAADNTLVLFLSDNGADGNEETGSTTRGIPPGTKESSHIYGRPWANLSNTPWRGYKHQMYEGGISTPLVACWPAVIKPGQMTHQPGHVIDLLPTLLEVAAATYPSTFGGRELVPLEGSSLLPILKTGQRTPPEALFWEHEDNRAVRVGNWKLVTVPKGPWELYDLSVDRTEQNDLAGAHPEMVERLSARYGEWFRRIGGSEWSQLKRP